jgi:uncharacterized membrane protein
MCKDARPSSRRLFLNTYQARWQLAVDDLGCGFIQGKTIVLRRSDLAREAGWPRSRVRSPRMRRQPRLRAFGAAIIVLGAIVSSFYFLWQLLKAGVLTEAYHAYRANLGRGILLGLEFLIAADIIGTVAVEPTLKNLGVLAIIVLIRTFLSFALEVEIQGHWPRQHSRITNK